MTATSRCATTWRTATSNRTATSARCPARPASGVRARSSVSGEGGDDRSPRPLPRSVRAMTSDPVMRQPRVAPPRLPRSAERPVVVSPIGFVRSPCRDPEKMPGQGITARIEVLPRYRPELIGVELSSHVIVVGWFHEAHRPRRGAVPTIRPVGIPPRGSFATRSPSRPNPISLTVVRVSARMELTLEVEGLDLVDGTAVLDLKPYIPGQDGVFSAIRSWRSRMTLGAGRLLDSVDPELRNHLGNFADLPAARAWSPNPARGSNGCLEDFLATDRTSLA